MSPAASAASTARPRLRCRVVLHGVLSTSLVAWAAVASAHDSPQSYLAAIDRDADGLIDVIEFQRWMIRGFDRLDRNGNGVLDIDEQPAGARRRPVARGQQLQAYAEAFVRQDSNGNGVLDARELAQPPR